MQSTDDREAMRRWVETWKIAGEELDRMKWDELRAMTEDDAARIFAMLDHPLTDCWRAPDRLNGAGLIEQQRWFAKGHGSTRCR